MKLILNNNPVVVLQEFEKAVKSGYLFVPGRSDLFIHSTGLMEMELYKQELEIDEISFEDELGIVYLADYDKIKFMLSLQRYVLNGYQIDLNSVVYNIIGTKRCKLIRPDHPSLVCYDEDSLKNMPYEELKQIAKIRKCFNKTKDIMIRNIIKFQQG